MKYGNIINFRGSNTLKFKFNNPYLPRHFEDKDHWWTFSKKRDVTRWTLTLITGFLCGLVALFVNFFTKIITKWKYNVFHGLIESEKAGTISPGIGFIFLFAVNLVFALIAWFTCYMEPLASGSGLCMNKFPFTHGLTLTLKLTYTN
jgi:H+/Cl- antiporter ClcA